MKKRQDQPGSYEPFVLEILFDRRPVEATAAELRLAAKFLIFDSDANLEVQF